MYVVLFEIDGPQPPKYESFGKGRSGLCLSDEYILFCRGKYFEASSWMFLADPMVQASQLFGGNDLSESWFLSPRVSNRL